MIPSRQTRTLPRSIAWLAAALLAPAALSSLVGCGSQPATPSAQSDSSSPSSSPPSPGSSLSAGATATPADAVVLDIRLENGQTSPNGTKINVRRGQTVVLNVLADHADQVHVHGDYDVDVDVSPGTPVSRSFVADSPESVEVESHHPEKVIAILNIR